MTAVTRAKLALAGAAVLVFIVGARFDNGALRWLAVALLLAAFLLRFHKPRT